MNKMRVCRARIFEILDSRRRAAYHQTAMRLEKSALRTPTIAPLFSSANQRDGYTLLCNRVPSGSL